MKTAEKDIPVKKVLSTSMSSPYFPVLWEKNKARELNFAISAYIGGKNALGEYVWVVEAGFHSCKKIFCVDDNNFAEYFTSQPEINRSNFRLMQTYSGNSGDFAVYDAIIPKGSNYYVNEYGEYVSNRLMINEMCEPEYAANPIAISFEIK